MPNSKHVQQIVHTVEEKTFQIIAVHPENANQVTKQVENPRILCTEKDLGDPGEDQASRESTGSSKQRKIGEGARCDETPSRAGTVKAQRAQFRGLRLDGNGRRHGRSRHRPTSQSFGVCEVNLATLKVATVRPDNPQTRFSQKPV